ncbi:MAG: hypothetical protein AB7F99_10670 [Vicinamibacterales bacterium]
MNARTGTGLLSIAMVSVFVCSVRAQQAESQEGEPPAIESRVLATNRTSTLEEELNEAAEAGFRLAALMGGETAIGGNEVVAVVTRNAESTAQYNYRLLATNRTSTMAEELREAADVGFEYKGQTIFKTMFGGQEVVVILERNRESTTRGDYRLLATSRTSTLEKELLDAGASGYVIVGMTVAQTAMGGRELVAIVRRDAQ